jgi:hypothetical protein
LDADSISENTEMRITARVVTAGEIVDEEKVFKGGADEGT